MNYDKMKQIEELEKLVQEKLNKLIKENFSGNLFSDEIDEIIQENLDILDEVKKGLIGPLINGINKDLIDPVNRTIRDGVSGLSNTLNSMIDGLQKGVKGFFSVLLIIVNFINETASRFIQMGNGMNQIFTSLFVTEVNALGKGLRIGFNNVGELMKWSGEFVFSYINCGVQYIQNMHRCIYFYALDTVGYLLYTIFIEIPLWIMKTFLRMDLYGTLDKLWEKVYEADKYVFGLTGFHIAHYPKNVRDLCYNCKRMKVNALKNKVKQINYDFNQKLPDLLQSGIKGMQDGSNEFKNAFNSKFEIPKGQKRAIDEKSIKEPTIPKVNLRADNVIPRIRF
jgi:hypothetical protein